MFVVSYQQLRASINVICVLYLQLSVLAVNTLKPSEILEDHSGGFFLFVFTCVSTFTTTDRYFTLLTAIFQSETFYFCLFWNV